MDESKKPRARKRPRVGANLAEAAAHFGVSLAMVSKWEKSKWVVRHSDRSIDLDATGRRVDAMKDNRRGGKPDRGTNAVDAPSYSGDGGDRDAPGVAASVEDMANARARKEHWQAVKAELDAKKLQGELVSLADAERIYCAHASSVRAALDSVPIRASSRLDGVTSTHDKRVIIRDEIDAALKGLHDDPPELG